MIRWVQWRRPRARAPKEGRNRAARSRNSSLFAEARLESLNPQLLGNRRDGASLHEVGQTLRRMVAATYHVRVDGPRQRRVPPAHGGAHEKSVELRRARAAPL